MIIRQINTFKDGDLKAIFNSYQQFENYVFNLILNKKDQENTKHFIKIVDRIPLNNGLPDEMNRVVYFAEKAKEYGFKVFISLEL